MKNNTNDGLLLLNKLYQLRQEIYEEGTALFHQWKDQITNASFIESARNLAFYLALRRRDIRHIQGELKQFGLSTLENIESCTLENLDTVIASLNRINNLHEYPYPPKKMCVRGKQQLDLNASRILGDPPTNRYTRIMVTLPSKAAKNEAFVEELLSQGMNVARINCAHDNEEVWLQMIENIRKAEQKLNKSCKILMDIAGPKIRIERLLTTHKNPRVQIGDRFFLTDKNSLKNFYGASIVAGISFKNIIPKLKFGDPVLFDDGTVEGIVSQIFDEGVMVEVERVKSKKGVRMRAKKGLTFPETDFKLDILTEKDKKDLDFVCEYADIIGVSFVKDVKDIRQIQQEINNRVTEPKASEMALMLKIETVEGVVNLPELLVAAAGKNPTAVMIARGDLAVEAGYLQLAEFQPIIINLCEAADVPVVWATQVLENLMKTGIPTRAEITDAAEAAIAECVMLNKGEYVLDGIKFLADLLEKKGSHQYKKMSLLQPLEYVNISNRKG